MEVTQSSTISDRAVSSAAEDAVAGGSLYLCPIKVKTGYLVAQAAQSPGESLAHEAKADKAKLGYLIVHDSKPKATRSRRKAGAF